MARSLLIGCLLSFFIIPLAHGDLVQTPRGEFHNGVVRPVEFKIETDYGLVAVSSTVVRLLERFPSHDRLVSHNGELIRGRLSAGIIQTTRQLGPPLDLSLDDILRIEFSLPQNMDAVQRADVVEMNNGDVLLIRPLQDTLMMQFQTGNNKIELSELKAIDFTFSEDQDAIAVRLMMQNGHYKKAVIENEAIAVSMVHGNDLSLPVKEISALYFDTEVEGFLTGGQLFPVLHKKSGNYKTLQDRFVNGGLGPELIVIPSGEYLRGQMNGDFDEQPVQKVVISKPFALSRYEITFDDFEKFCLETKRSMPDTSGWGRGKRPVINVSWQEAKEYIEWLGKVTGATYRFPTDAEWEYAARAQTQSVYYWGDEPGEEKANCAGCLTIWESERTARVGRFSPNGFGLYDMAGNVFEWTQDCWNNSFQDIALDGQAYENPAGCGKRVIRGGGWSFPPKEIRSANRWRDFPTRQSDDTGFRVVRELD